MTLRGESTPYIGAAARSISDDRVANVDCPAIVGYASDRVTRERAVGNTDCARQVGDAVTAIARQGAVGCYRQIPRLLVEPFLGLHVLGDGRNVDRTLHPINACRVYRRVCGEGKRDGCHDDA